MAREVLKKKMKDWGHRLGFVFLMMLMPVVVILFFIVGMIIGKEGDIEEDLRI